ncbi:acyl-CoA dehydrogenase family protein [Mycolicibacter senuensis]|jgi:alkylation response protein AidB-like acyl-CoA dehydrogenase|uniref:Acyl-CoA dehydrogenase n=1 Tax=Mycolicibacter senuensis TaxID=386913 RepID=A0A7I9XT08_9MYCO|nr:acyl-CoA dehydrogenase family protein [Mycolicibacter senuensis]ORW67176.1 acyl-CoA dehydrogenase [Mycolicibacter senuensis]GFG72407.1 acyl-CoA dehydrogenase [Mycolicibacter senuensis]
MDVRLNAEQRQLREAAAKLADDLGPGSVAELDDAGRVARLEKAVVQTGWRELRSDGASGVEVAIVAEEFGRGLVDVPFLGPVLADDLVRHVKLGAEPATVTHHQSAVDARGAEQAVTVREHAVLTAPLGALRCGADLTRPGAELAGEPRQVGELSAEDAAAAHALALVTTGADLIGTARGAHALACDYAKIREQYGKPIGSYQAIAHLLAEGLALIEGSVSVLRHAAWAVDEADAADAVRAARIAKIYCARTARTVCETAIQVHGGIGNTWECLAHVYLRRALTSTGLWPVTIREIADGLS